MCCATPCHVKAPAYSCRIAPSPSRHATAHQNGFESPAHDPRGSSYCIRGINLVGGPIMLWLFQEGKHETSPLYNYFNAQHAWLWVFPSFVLLVSCVWTFGNCSNA